MLYLQIRGASEKREAFLSHEISLKLSPETLNPQGGPKAFFGAGSVDLAALQRGFGSEYRDCFRA